VLVNYFFTQKTKRHRDRWNSVWRYLRNLQLTIVLCRTTTCNKSVGEDNFVHEIRFLYAYHTRLCCQLVMTSYPL